MRNKDKETGWAKVWPALVATIIGGIIVYILTTGQLPKITDVIREWFGGNPTSVESTAPGAPEERTTEGETDSTGDSDANGTSARTDPSRDEDDRDAVTLVAVPNVEGMEQYEAMDFLTKSGLLYEVVKNQEAGAEGDEVYYVRSQSVFGSTMVPSGTVISLQLQTGTDIAVDSNEENEYDLKLKEEGWVFLEEIKTTGVPSDTPTDRYVFVRLEWNDNSLAPLKIWRHYGYPKG